MKKPHGFSVATVGVVGSLVTVLLQVFSWFWQLNNFENRLIFDEVKAYKNCAIFGPPSRSSELEVQILL